MKILYELSWLWETLGIALISHPDEDDLERLRKIILG